MGFPKAKATNILKAVFNTGNKIALLTAVNTETDAYTEASGAGYQRYEIKSGDFTTNDGVTTTARHILFGLAEGSWGTIVGIAVFSGSSLEYLAELEEAKAVGANTVPVFRKYDGTDGIRVALDAEPSAAASVNEMT